MEILVIDGQGGGLGRQLVAATSAACPEARLTAPPPARTPWWWAAAGRMSFWGPSAL